MNMPTEIESKQLLPDYLVLEIVARYGTIADAIRCAAVSKSLRRGILNADFLRYLRRRFLLRDGGGEGEHGDGLPFNPKLLLGLYHQSVDPRLPPSFVPASGGAKLPPSLAALPPAPNRDDAGDSECDFGPYLPVYSRCSLLVLRRRCKNTTKEHIIERHGPHPVVLSVCNPNTGERRVLPPHDVHDMSHALLDVDPIAPSSSFKLLVAELSNDNPSMLYVQIFSSGKGEWGPALACPIVRSGERRRLEFVYRNGRPRPVVLGDTVHWLCTSRHGDCILTWRWGGDVAHEDEASIVDLPPRHRLRHLDKCLAVLPSPNDTAGAESQAMLSLIAIEIGGIEVWAREKSGDGSAMRWNLWHRVPEAAIPRPRDVSSRWLRVAELSGFCEGSGTLFFRAGDATISPLLLDLDTMEVSKLDAREWDLNPDPEFCPYEVDQLSHMLFRMKQF